MNLLVSTLHLLCYIFALCTHSEKKFNQKMSSYSKFNNNINVLQRIFKKQNVKQHSVCQALVSVYSLLSTKGVKGKKGVHHQKAHKGKKSFVLRLIYCFNYILRPQKEIRIYVLLGMYVYLYSHFAPFFSFQIRIQLPQLWDLPKIYFHNITHHRCLPVQTDRQI